MNGDLATDAAGNPGIPATSRDVFISYASQDSAVAQSVCTILEQAGIRCWIAPRDVSPGEFYADAIVRALNEASVLVLILTDAAIASPHVLREVERTSAKRHAIATLRITSLPLSHALEYFLSASHWLDARSSNFDSSLLKLVEAVKRLLAPPAAATPAKSKSDLFHRPFGARSASRLGRPLIGLIGVIAVTLAYLVADRVWLSTRTHEPALAPTAAIPAPALVAPNSIAVLPFADMTEKKDQEYFSDGLSEELIDRLARIPELTVSARTSSFYFKGKQTTVAEIARTLGVANLLEGSVRRSGNRLRVTVQLIRAANGYQLWSETYDRKFDDVFRIQDEISQLVAKAMKLALVPEVSVEPGGTVNVNANDLYLHAKFLFWQLTKDGMVQSVELLHKALALDPNFARAWALLSRARAAQAYSDGSSASGGPAAFKDARMAAEKAVALAPLAADGHLALGRIYLKQDDNPAKAQEEFDRAAELEPRNADAQLQLGNPARTEGRMDEAIRAAQHALAMDPLNANIMVELEEDYLSIGDAAAAEPLARRVASLYPANTFWKSDLAAALVIRGKMQEAYDLAESDAQDEHDRLFDQAFFLPELGRQAEADAALSHLESADRAKVPPVIIAMIYERRGQHERALDWLDRQYALEPADLQFINRNSYFIGLRGNERFKALLRKLNLPELQQRALPQHQS